MERCHCGAAMRGSDHCPCCGCEEFEATCDHKHDRTTCDSPACEAARENFERSA